MIEIGDAGECYLTRIWNAIRRRDSSKKGFVWVGENILALLIACILARAILIFVTLVKFPSAIYGSYAGHGECHDIGF